MNQDRFVTWIAIVSLVRLLWRGFRIWGAQWIAQRLLNRGQVKWAMRFRSLAQGSVRSRGRTARSR